MELKQLSGASIKLMIRYPWSHITIDFLKKNNIDIEYLLSQQALIDKAKKRVIKILEKKKASHQTEESFEEVYVYYITLILVTATESFYLARLISTFEQKRAFNYLKDEDNIVLVNIARNTFGWDISHGLFKINETAYEFRIHFINYLDGSRNINDKYWQLVNKLIKEGYVYLSKKEIARLLSEKVREKVFEKITKTKIKRIPAQLETAVKEIKEIIEKTEMKFYSEKKIKRKSSDIFPPCMRYILNKIKKGENLPHIARFAITSFLLNAGFSVDDVIDIWRLSPDFDEDIARYQVEHIAGLRGSGTKYTPPSCKTLKVHGICTEEMQCDEEKNPIRYYFRRLRGMKTNESKKHNVPQK